MIDIDVIRMKALDRLDNKNVLYNIKEVESKIRYRFRGWCEDSRDAHVVFELQNGIMIVTVIEEGFE